MTERIRKPNGCTPVAERIDGVETKQWIVDETANKDLQRGVTEDACKSDSGDAAAIESEVRLPSVYVG